VAFLKVCDGLNIQDMFPVWLAIPRVAGLLAHWIEALDDPDYKIFRPRQVYTGEQGLFVSKALARSESQSNLDASYKSSNAAKRRNQGLVHGLIYLDDQQHSLAEIEDMIKKSKVFLKLICKGCWWWVQLELARKGTTWISV
jgi:hypothetical protein